MRSGLLWLCLFGLLGLVGASRAISGNSTASTPTWGRAIQVPGTAGRVATVESVSCPKAGTCAGGGQLSYGRSHQAFVVDEKNGTWGNAMRLKLAVGVYGAAYVTSVSCATAGNCTAGGNYSGSSHYVHAFVVDEKHGRWDKAHSVPGLATLSGSGGISFMESVSCATPGNCAAGGEYVGGSGTQGAFVVDEKNGGWGKAIQVPGTDALSGGGQTVVVSVSCTTPGNCAAGGYYDSSNVDRAFVVDETNGSWGNAIEVPGTDVHSQGAAVSSVSCGASGACSAGGAYRDGPGEQQAFVVDETNGSWGDALEIPGIATLNGGGTANVSSISCATAGDCAAGGSYTDDSDNQQAFVVDKTNGSWVDAIEVPSTADLNAGPPGAIVNSVSCATAGNCSAGGHYTDSSDNFQLFVVDETEGSWGNAIKVPGTALTGSLFSDLNSVSCGAPGVCVAGGYYAVGNSLKQVAFVAGSGTRPLTVPSRPHLKSATPGDRKIEATWRKPADKGGVPIAGYRVTAKAGSHVFTCGTRSKLSCTIAGLKNGTTYTVTVVAKNTVGRSRPSNSKRARPRA